MKLTRHGQSLIEYTLIIVLIIAGVVLMGPYTIRNINAHFRFWDDAAQESFNENIGFSHICLDETDPAYDPNDPGCTSVDGECSCSPWQGQPGWRCGLSPCGLTERLEHKKCSPLGCELSCTANPDSPGCSDDILNLKTERCVPDPLCCSTPVKTDFCGRVLLDDCARNAQEGSTCEGFVNPTDACAVGERIYEFQCGSPGGTALQYKCIPDEFCALECIGEPNINAQFCPGDDEGLATAGAPSSLPISYIGVGKNSCSNDRHDIDIYPVNKCRAYCDDGFIPTGTTCACEDLIESRNEINQTESDQELVFSTPNYGTLVDFDVKVWSEDLQFWIDFYDENNIIIDSFWCHSQNNRNHAENNLNGRGTLSNSCGYDGANDEDTYTTPTIQASRVNIRIVDWGDPIADFNKMGYEIHVEGDCCKDTILDENLSTAQEAGGSASVTTTPLPTPTPITVDVFTEDLQFDIKFYDTNGLISDAQYACNKSKDSDALTDGEFYTENQHDGSITSDGRCGEDGDKDYSHFKVTKTATHVEVTVREGGNADSSKFGWNITAASDCNKPETSCTPWTENSGCANACLSDGTCPTLAVEKRSSQESCNELCMGVGASCAWWWYYDNGSSNGAKWCYCFEQGNVEPCAETKNGECIVSGDPFNRTYDRYTASSCF